MYLVRTIQKTEKSSWVAHLGKHAGYRVPLPCAPRQPFKGLVIIHGQAASLFNVATIVRHAKAVNVPVGSGVGIVVKAKTEVFVLKGPIKTGRALIRGFQGIRYMTWSAVAR